MNPDNKGMTIEKLEECVRDDPMPYRWDGLMEHTAARWMQRAYEIGRAEIVRGEVEVELRLARLEDRVLAAEDILRKSDAEVE